MGSRSQSGVTLIELMIVVAIVAVLVAIAVFTFTGATNQAKAKSEVGAMFAEIKLRQRDYHAERGAFLTMATGGSDEDSGIYHPTPPSMSQATLIDPMPDEWRELKLAPDKNALHCAYTTIAGAGGDGGNLGGRAALFGMTAAPATDWFYIVAECDLDGDPAVNSLYFARSDIDGIAERNAGR